MCDGNVPTTDLHKLPHLETATTEPTKFFPLHAMFSKW